MKTLLLLFFSGFSICLFAQQDNDSIFNSLIAKGDSLIESGQNYEAEFNYDKACELNPSNCPKEKLETIYEQRRLAGDYPCRSGNEYKKIISVADKCFSEKNYVKAKSCYERALKIHPTDSHPKQQLLAIEELLSKD